MVPELEVSNFQKSLDFYVRVLGFSVLYDRPERPFAYLGLDAAHIMIETGGTWITGELEPPLGRGMNLQIAVSDISLIATRLTQAEWSFFREIEDVWYRRGNEFVGARELVVQDPDGYLLRFSESLGARSAQGWSADAISN